MPFSTTRACISSTCKYSRSSRSATTAWCTLRSGTTHNTHVHKTNLTLIPFITLIFACPQAQANDCKQRQGLALKPSMCLAEALHPPHVSLIPTPPSDTREDVLVVLELVMRRVIELKHALVEWNPPRQDLQSQAGVCACTCARVLSACPCPCARAHVRE